MENKPARGRARGRGRSSGQLQQTAVSRGSRVAPSESGVARGSGLQAPQVSALEAGINNVKLSEQPGSSAPAIPGRGGGRSSQIKQGEILKTKPAHINTKKGIHGTSVIVQSNYFKLETSPKWTLYQYRVDVSPLEERTHVLKGCMKDHRAKLGGGYLYDGSMLYTTSILHPDPLILYSKRKEDDQTLTFTLKLVHDVVRGDYGYFQVFNLIMRKCYSALKLQLMGRDFFDVNAKIDIKQYKLQIWPGYRTTISQYENSIMMVAEIVHKVVRMDTVLDLYIGQCKADKQAFKQAILGQVVLTDYNNRTYQVTDVDFDRTPNSTFPINGKEISFMEYYKQKYNRTVNLNQPLLLSKAKDKDIRRGASDIIHLIPEFCRMTGLSDRMRTDFRLMKDIAEHTRVSAKNRISRLQDFNRRIRSVPECGEIMSSWNMKLSTELVSIKARVLPQERIRQADNKEFDSGDTTDGWSRSLRTNRMMYNADVQRWVVIVPQALSQSASSFVEMILNNARAMQWVLPRPTVVNVQNDLIQQYINALERALAECNPNIVLCICRGNDNLYKAVKRKCSIERATVTQVVTQKTLNNRNAMTIATKVLIQMNVKMGGSPWTVHVPMKGAMVIGYDVCHDPSDKTNSYGAMVAALDQDHSKYYSSVTKHTNGEELAKEFEISIKKAMAEFYKLNQFLPTLVLIYRDGVGEGQIRYVYENEVQSILKALEEIYNGKPFKLQFTIVSKRLNTRFFMNMSNPKPGTVMDDVVTSPERYDYFLVSQAVRDGTVAPTSYNVIYDNTGLDADKTQRLTYKFCHLYYNLTASIRVPSVCNYAHKLAFLASQLKASPNHNLRQVLHFI